MDQVQSGVLEIMYPRIWLYVIRLYSNHKAFLEIQSTLNFLLAIAALFGL